MNDRLMVSKKKRKAHKYEVTFDICSISVFHDSAYRENLYNEFFDHVKEIINNHTPDTDKLEEIDLDKKEK